MDACGAEHNSCHFPKSLHAMSKVVCTATTCPEGDQSADTWRITGIGDQRLDKRMVDSTIVECRLFFTPGEDCYLPGIDTALQNLITPERAKARRSLKQYVAQVVVGPRIGPQALSLTRAASKLTTDWAAASCLALFWSRWITSKELPMGSPTHWSLSATDSGPVALRFALVAPRVASLSGRGRWRSPLWRIATDGCCPAREISGLSW